MKINVYKINNNVEKVKQGRNTLFLDQKELSSVTSMLKGIKYNIYFPCPDSEKVILYTGKIPKIKLFKINAVENLRHQDILGSLYALNVDPCYFGDIVLYEQEFYVYVAFELADFIMNNLVMVGGSKVELVEVALNTLDHYKRNYEEINLIVSSVRLDNVISSLINVSRQIANDKIKDKEVIINYCIASKSSYLLKENDLFSIRKYGKYKFIGIVKSTKKNNHVIKLLKYI